MKILKRLLSFVMLLALVMFVSMQVSAVGPLTPLKDQNGNTIYHIGNKSSEPVMIPTVYSQKDREFRGAWVTQLAGDIPAFSTKETYISTMMGVLDTLESYNINSLIYHIRIMNDALYDTDLSPQSKYTANVNYDEWDYLEWLIDEVHRRGMEFHAWLNPYRIQNGVQDASLIADKYVNYPDNPASNPDMILVGSAGAILNPGEPAVRDFVVDTSMEIIEKYDVDAIHFDDYFYITMEPNADLTTYNKYKSQSQTTNIEDWRREQVDLFIRDLSGEMRSYNNINNRQVQLGISPSGVWKSDRTGKGVTGYDANGNAITDGSNTSTTFEHYKSYLYSDTKKWIDEEWIDYILPQLYWGLQHTTAPYAALVDWWKDVVKHKDVNLYIGMGLYQLVANEKFWSRDPYEASKQVLYSNQYEDVRGITIYKYSSINSTKSNPGVMKIKNEYWNKPVLNPIIRTLEPVIPGSLENVNIKIKETGFEIDWQPTDNGKKYAIYRNSGVVDHNDPNQLIGVVGVSPDSNLGVIDDIVDSNLDYNYAIVPLSGTNHKGDPFIFNTNAARPVEPIPDFATMEDIWLTGPVLRNQEFQINWNKGIVNIGTDLVYELQTSFDQLTWNTVTYGRLTTSQNSYSYYLTNSLTTTPVYYRLIAKNEVGEIITNTLKVTPDISMGDIWLTGSTLPGEKYSINWIEGVVKDNKTLVYELQSSIDQLTWVAVVDGQVTKSETTYSHNLLYPDTLLPIYYRLIAKNEIGEIVTNTLKVFPDITMEEIWISGTALPNEEYRINWNKGIVNKGTELVYELQTSTDQLIWTVVTEGRVNTSGNMISQYLIYPSTTLPIYYRVVARNDIGEIISNTVKVVPTVTNINQYIDLTVSLVNDRLKKTYTK